jgi:hypothetical protein
MFIEVVRFRWERRKEKGERRNSHAGKGDCEADELTANKGETIRIGHLKTLKRSDLKTL